MNDFAGILGIKMVEPHKRNDRKFIAFLFSTFASPPSPSEIKCFASQPNSLAARQRIHNWMPKNISGGA